MEKTTIKKDIAKMATGAIAGITVMALATAKCAVFTVCLIITTLIVLFVALSKINGETFTKRGKIAIMLVILALVSVGTYHKYFCHQEEVQPEVNVQQEETVEESEESEEPAEESVEPAEATSSVARPARGYCPEDEKMEMTEQNSEVPAKAETTAPNTTATIKVEDNSDELADTEKAVEEAEKNGDTVKELDNGIIAIEKDQEVEEKGETQKVEIDTDSAEDLKNEGEAPSKNIENEDKFEDVEASDNETLDDMLEESTTEITEDTTSETTEETTEVVTNPANGNVSIEEVTEVENNNNVIDAEEIEEPVVDEVAKIEVNAVDGYEGYINSTMQFSIEGDDVVLEGLDGIDYSFSNGILSINTGDCATVLTITASNSVSSQTFDVVINGIVG